jgi:hypothetical protein
MFEKQLKVNGETPLTVGGYISRKQLSFPAQVAIYSGISTVALTGVALSTQLETLDEIYALIGSVFELHINKLAIQQVCYAAAIPLAIAAVLLAVTSLRRYRIVPHAREIKRRILEIMVSVPGQHIITKDTPMSTVRLRIKRGRNVVAITSENLYLSEITWNTPEVLKFLGAKVAIVSGETLLLGYGKTTEEATQAVYRRAEKAVRS